LKDLVEKWKLILQPALGKQSMTGLKCIRIWGDGNEP